MEARNHRTVARICGRIRQSAGSVIRCARAPRPCNADFFRPRCTAQCPVCEEPFKQKEVFDRPMRCVIQIFASERLAFRQQHSLGRPRYPCRKPAACAGSKGRQDLYGYRLKAGTRNVRRLIMVRGRGADNQLADAAVTVKRPIPEDRNLRPLTKSFRGHSPGFTRSAVACTACWMLAFLQLLPSRFIGRGFCFRHYHPVDRCKRDRDVKSARRRCRTYGPIAIFALRCRVGYRTFIGSACRCGTRTTPCTWTAAMDSDRGSNRD